jgi:hypothetical protein
MRAIKFVITMFFLCISYWVIVLIFGREFAHVGIKYAAESWNENTLMILLIATGQSCVAVFCLGVLSMFVRFVFVKLVYAEEIKHAAYYMIKNRKKRDSQELLDFRQGVANNEIAKLPMAQRILARASHYWNVDYR